eukprot:TRINITY_DN1398_c0_g1_i1.p2 TRINITY_DN1398_c0_g1~~TRINITY_DN1398_c0_g1_i1.p2  ORF type:complete len:281 (-),score=32.57 TRINITY_DN1398_c0_g1_i1:408-1250(-)
MCIRDSINAEYGGPTREKWRPVPRCLCCDRPPLARPSGIPLMDDDKTSAELIGELVSDFFSKAVVEPISAVNAEFESLVGPAPPPVLRQVLTERLTTAPKPARSSRRAPRMPLKKEERLRMEAALMLSPQVVCSEPSEPTRARSASDSSASTSPTSSPLDNTTRGSGHARFESLSPPETPGDPVLGMMPPVAAHSPSPEIEVPGHHRVRSRALSKDAEPNVVRRRAKSKEERQAEEMGLMKEFRRRDLSTWLTPPGADDELADGVTEVSFVPYSPFVKSR